MSYALIVTKIWKSNQFSLFDFHFVFMNSVFCVAKSFFYLLHFHQKISFLPTSNAFSLPFIRKEISTALNLSCESFSYHPDFVRKWFVQSVKFWVLPKLIIWESRNAVIHSSTFESYYFSSFLGKYFFLFVLRLQWQIESIYLWLMIRFCCLSLSLLLHNFLISSFLIFQDQKSKKP